LQRTSNALVSGDAEELKRLLGTVSEVRPAMRNAAEAVRLRQGLAMLLKETARNLRLLRIASGAHPGNVYGRHCR
jgi:hypothetical protein